MRLILFVGEPSPIFALSFQNAVPTSSGTTSTVGTYAYGPNQLLFSTHNLRDMDGASVSAHLTLCTVCPSRNAS
jgi:hypothetical protein